MSDTTMTDRALDHAPRDYENKPAGTNANAPLRVAGDNDSANVGQVERLISVVSGGVFVAFGLKQRSWLGLGVAALGGALAYRGVTGHCDLYDTIGVSTAEKDHEGHIVTKKEIKVAKSVTINKAPDELYRFWRNFENLPRFMKHLESVTVQDAMHSHWVAKAPAGQKVEWDAEIINEIDGQLIAWRSTENADIRNVGSVHFDPAPGDRGTVVRVVLQYDPPVGKIGALVAKLFGEEPSLQVEEDLHRFKQLMEAGEIPTTEGQPSARKDGHSKNGKKG